MTIYNRDGKSINMQVPEKPINYILVLVLDGDEAAVVFFGDLSSVYLDEKPDRKVSQFNTSYIVNKDVLDAWMSYKPESAKTRRLSVNDLWKVLRKEDFNLIKQGFPLLWRRERNCVILAHFTPLWYNQY